MPDKFRYFQFLFHFFDFSPCSLSSQHDVHMDLDTNSLSLKHIHSFSKLLSDPNLFHPFVSCSWGSWLMFIITVGHLHFRPIFHPIYIPPERTGILMSFKSHYGCGSAPGKTDFLWFCSGGEEMREAKSLWSKIQMDMGSHKGYPLKLSVPRGSFHHGGVPF